MFGLQVLTPSGFKPFKGIRRLSKECLKFTFNNNGVIICSTDHKFSSDNSILKASSFNIGDKLQHRVEGIITIIAIENIGLQNVYDLIDVGEDHIYFTNDIISHNCSFSGSSKTLVKISALETMIFGKVQEEMYDGDMKVYEKPVRGFKYILGVDVGEGTGNDYSVVQVGKINGINDFEQVAVYANNSISAKTFAKVIDDISVYYNEAEIMLENNNAGGITANELWYVLENESLINIDPAGKGKELGVRSTKKSKREAALNMKDCIEYAYCKICDEKTIAEFSNFVQVRPGIYKCKDESGHDDHVTSWMWLCYYFLTEYFDPEDYKNKDNTKKLTPLRQLQAAEEHDDSNIICVSPEEAFSGNAFFNGYVADPYSTMSAFDNYQQNPNGGSNQWF